MAGTEVDFYKYVSLYNRHKTLFFVVALCVATCFTLVSYLLPKKYEATCIGVVEISLVSDLIKGITVMPSLTESLNEMRNALTSRSLITKTLKEVDFGSQANTDLALDKLITDLQKSTIVIFKEKEYFSVSFRHRDPVVAREYVNALVRNFIEQNVNANRNQTYEAGRFLSEQIEKFKKEIEEKEAEINQLKAEKGDAANYDRASVIAELDVNERKLIETKQRRGQLEEMKTFRVKQLEEENPEQTRLRELQNRLNSLRSQYTETYPEVIMVRSQIEALEQETRAQRASAATTKNDVDLWKIEAELKAVGENERQLERLIASRKLLLQTIPEVKSILEKLEAEKENRKNMYDMLLIRKNQSEVSKQVELQDKGFSYRVTEPATTPLKPVSPNRRVIMLLGLLAGLGGGAGLLMGLDFLDPAIRSVSALEQTNLPVLAVVPLIRSEREEKVKLFGDMLLYGFAGVWLLALLVVMALELIGSTVLEQVAAQWHVPPALLHLLDNL